MEKVGHHESEGETGDLEVLTYRPIATASSQSEQACRHYVRRRGLMSVNRTESSYDSQANTFNDIFMPALDIARPFNKFHGYCERGC